jgi:hypothetical protein
LDLIVTFDPETALVRAIPADADGDPDGAPVRVRTQ